MACNVLKLSKNKNEATYLKNSHYAIINVLNLSIMFNYHTNTFSS